VCHGFRLTKRDDYFWVTFDPFTEAAGAVKIGLSPKPNLKIKFSLSKSMKSNVHVYENRPRINFTNIFINSFYTRRSQKYKMTDDLTAFFTLLESAQVKVAHKMLMKLTPIR